MMNRTLTLFGSLTLALSSSAQVDTTLFNGLSLTEPVRIVNCTLSNGSSTQCYELKFYANDVDDSGPFCPQTINDVGGVAIYEPGSAGTNVGLAVLDSTLFKIIENDGFDIVDANGNININNPGAGGSMPQQGTSYCLQAEADDDLELTYLIPVTPELLSVPNTIETVEQLGVSLNGVPFKGNPPAVIGGGPGGGGTDVLMPSLDRCGGHHDPAGYYHWHMIANSTNDVLNDLGITSVSCTQFPQNNSGLIGFAMDGYPIYGQNEDASSLPTGLDACNGHLGVTAEYPNGVYHYHAVQGSAPNIPPCLVGASANGNFGYSFHVNDIGVVDLNINKVEVFPNPSNGQLVQVKVSADAMTIKDQLGRNVTDIRYIIHNDEGFLIDTSFLPDGVYYLVIWKRGVAETFEKMVISKD